MAENQIIHVEISSKDHRASEKFYHELFGWEVRQIPEMDYATFTTGEGQLGGGFNPINDDYPAGTVLFYVETAHIQDTLAKAESLGAKMLVPPTDIPGVGQFAQFLDPNGNKIALLQPLEQM